MLIKSIPSAIWGALTRPAGGNDIIVPSAPPGPISSSPSREYPEGQAPLGLG